MKRFLLFAGEEYYPSGGWGDFKGSFRTRKEAREEATDLMHNGLNWYHIIDTENPPNPGEVE